MHVRIRHFNIRFAIDNPTYTHSLCGMSELSSYFIKIYFMCIISYMNIFFI